MINKYEKLRDLRIDIQNRNEIIKHFPLIPERKKKIKITKALNRIDYIEIYKIKLSLFWTWRKISIETWWENFLDRIFIGGK